MRGPSLTLLLLVAALLAHTTAGGAGDSSSQIYRDGGDTSSQKTFDTGPTTKVSWGQERATSIEDAEEGISQTNSDTRSTRDSDGRSIADKTEIPLERENSESVTKVKENSDLDSKISKKSTETELDETRTTDKISINTDTIEENKDSTVTDKHNEENKAVNVRSTKQDENINTGISKESTNENSRISKKFSTLSEVVSNKLVTDAEVDFNARTVTEQSAKTSACPSSCSCSGGVLMSAQCTLRGGAGVTVTQEGDKYTVECQSQSNAAMMQVFMPDDEGEDNATDLYTPITTTPHISCSDLPSLSPWLKPSRTEGITLVVRGCDVRINCLVETLGGKVTSLMIQDAEEWRMQDEDVKGLQELQELGLYYHEYPSITFPSSAVSFLPRLRTLTISGATLSLPHHHPLPRLDLTRLELSNCRLSNLHDGVFKELRMLERLYLQTNQIKEIKGGVFEGLSNLLELGISSNLLSTVPVHELATHCPRLTVLSAFDNGLTTIGDLRHLKELTELELFYNRVPLTLQPGSLSNLPKLRIVDLRDSGVTSLSLDVISNSTRLQTLLLQGNDIKELDEGVFLQQKELEILDLSKNNLTKLHPGVFSGLTALKELRLDGNNITELPNGLTSSLRSLRTLSMRDSGLMTVNVNSLNGCPDLTTLLLSANQLTTVWMDTDMTMDQIGLILNGLRQLEVIDLSHNNLTAAPSDVTSLLSVKRLDLSANLIGHVNDLNFLSESVTVDLSHNQIQSLSLIEADTKDGESITNLVLLEDNPFVCNCLFYNAVRRIHGYRHPYIDRVELEFGNSNCSAPALLKGRKVTSLKEEDVYCDVTKEDYCNDGNNNCLPEDCTIAFRQYTKSLDIHCKEMPETLPDINGWPVTGIRMTLDTPPPSLTNLTGVKMLNMSGLDLMNVPAGMPPSSVQVIDLSDNNLTDIPVDLLKNNITIHLSRNPLRCDCWSSSAVSFMQQQRHLVADYDNATCASDPPGGYGTPLRRVSAEQLCSAQTAAAIGGTLAAIGLIAGILAVILLRYRVEAEILLAKAGVMRRRDETTDGKTFDAFVSYAHEDDAFVTRQLVPKLEGSEGLRLCIHSRDWLPGEWISSSIAASVAHSRRTLIILSNNFLQSRWGRLEFQAATRGSDDRHQRTRVIIVLLEDVSDHPELDPELKAYLRTNTYVKWGDPWFWKKLIHALPHHGKRKIPVRSICDVTNHQKVLDEVAEGKHPADVIMAANQLKGQLNPASNGKNDTKHDKLNEKLKLNTSRVINEITNDKLNEKLKLNPKLGMLHETRNDEFNDKLKDNLNNKLTAIEATLDALEELEGKRYNKAFQ